MELGLQGAQARIPHPQLSATIRAPSLVLRKVRMLVRLICWRTLRPTVRLSSGIVVTLKSDSDWEIANEIFLQRDYDEAIDEALLRPESVEPVRVLDLGANVGFFSLRCIERYVNAQPQARLELTLVEGSPSLFADLKERLSGFRSADGISLIARQGLVGRRNGKGMIYSSLFHSCTNAVVREGGKTSGNIFLGRHAEDSEYLDLDELVPTEGIIDLIKCDIEGSELEFLENYVSLLRRTRLLAIEFHPDHCSAGACHELLDEYGFIKVRTIKNHPTHSLELYANRTGSLHQSEA
ncbi:MAG TPA: FkbM family methyltransferase [Bryobacteraceae bacterium]|nr:FkbM family methyltransferase [Bryobacteraceae bacterium]